MFSKSKEKTGMVTVTFQHWTASGEDFYDFDPKEHLTLPNPDYQSKEGFAIEPQKQEITVFHTNAIRLENAQLAKPFKVRIRPWIVRNANLVANATIDPKKRL